MFKLFIFNCLKALSPVAMAASIFLLKEIPAKAVPHIFVSESRNYLGQSSRVRRVSAPPSLNITPPPGRHISLPSSSRSSYSPLGDRFGHRSFGNHYHSPYHYHQRRHRHHNRHHNKRYKRIIIINPVRRY